MLKWLCAFAALMAVNQDTLSLVSWNIDHGARLDLVATALANQSPDLCLLQEVDRNATRSGKQDVAEVLAKRLKMHMAYAIEFEELSQETDQPAYIGQATLSRLPIRCSLVLPFTHQSGFWKPRAWIPSHLSIMQRRIGGRVALVTELDWNGKLLVVYNAHLESRSAGPIQMAQLDEILTDLKTYPAGTPVVIGGDLNSKYFPSIFLRKLEREGFRSSLGERIERTHKIAMALDWIFVRGPFQWTSGAVRKDIKGSDHYPLVGALSTNTKDP